MQDGGLINQTTPAKINTPAVSLGHIYRSTVDNLFYCKLPDGTSVLIGGFAPGGGSGIAVYVSVDGTGLIYSAHVDGGTAPFTYSWSNVYAPRNLSLAAAVFSGATNLINATLADDDDSAALVRVRVTDANGLVAYGYFRYDNKVTPSST